MALVVLIKGCGFLGAKKWVHLLLLRHMASEVPNFIPAPLAIPKVQETRPFRASNGRSGTGGASVRARTPAADRAGRLAWHGKSLLQPRDGSPAVPVLMVHNASATGHHWKLGAVSPTRTVRSSWSCHKRKAAMAHTGARRGHGRSQEIMGSR